MTAVSFSLALGICIVLYEGVNQEFGLCSSFNGISIPCSSNAHVICRISSTNGSNGVSKIYLCNCSERTLVRAKSLVNLYMDI